MYYLFHGEDEFTLTKGLNEALKEAKDSGIADLNRSRFDGQVGLGELRHACQSVPFLAERREVIVEGMLSLLEPRRKKKDADNGKEDLASAPESEGNAALVAGLTELIQSLPEETHLFFIEHKALAKTNPILKYAEADKSKKRIRRFDPPKDDELPDWILKHAQEIEVQIERPAAQEMAAHIGADLRLIDTELHKLKWYRPGERITLKDVRALVADVHASNIFALVDAIGECRTDLALNLLHEQLRDRAQPAQLMGMIIRQFRLLLQIKDMGVRGMAYPAAAERLGINRWVAEKVAKQCARFTLPRLETAYDLLLQTDIAIKTGRSDAIVALDLLLVQLTQ